MKVGDILVETFGFEETHRAFYQVTKVSNGMCWYRHIRQIREFHDRNNGVCSPARDSFIFNEPYHSKIQNGENGEWIHIGSSGAKLWNGEKLSFSEGIH